MEYKVIWEIEVTADSPKEAAMEARAIQLDPSSEALHFEVCHPSFKKTSVFLMREKIAQ